MHAIAKYITSSDEYTKQELLGMIKNSIKHRQLYVFNKVFNQFHNSNTNKTNDSELVHCYDLVKNVSPIGELNKINRANEKYFVRSVNGNPISLIIFDKFLKQKFGFAN